MLGQLRQKIILSLAFAALVYFALTLYGDAPKLADAFLGWDWRWLPVVILAVLANYGLRFMRWHYYLLVIGIHNVPLRPSLLIFLSGFSLTMVPGKLGELLKSVLLKSHYDISISYSASIVAAERLTDTIGMTLLAAVGISMFPNGVPALVLIIIALVVAVVLLQSRTLAEKIIGLFERLPIIGKFANLAKNMYESAYLMLRIRPLIISVTLSIVAWFGECLALFLILLGFGQAPTGLLLLQSTFIYASASLFGAITLLPGGLGATEGTITSLTQLFVNTSATIAAATTLLVRVCTLWLAIILGSVALFILGRTGKPANLQELSIDKSAQPTDADIRAT
ncbi:MAG: flippase-like domain-containing protein [Chloroflexi bacterium]|nr:flippase-like domain-containing protein [Chloroflexota bacterium]